MLGHKGKPFPFFSLNVHFLIDADGCGLWLDEISSSSASNDRKVMFQGLPMVLCYSKTHINIFKCYPY